MRAGLLLRRAGLAASGPKACRSYARLQVTASCSSPQIPPELCARIRYSSPGAAPQLPRLAASGV